MSWAEIALQMAVLLIRDAWSGRPSEGKSMKLEILCKHGNRCSDTIRKRSAKTEALGVASGKQHVPRGGMGGDVHTCWGAILEEDVVYALPVGLAGRRNWIAEPSDNLEGHNSVANGTAGSHRRKDRLALVLGGNSPACAFKHAEPSGSELPLCLQDLQAALRGQRNRQRPAASVSKSYGDGGAETRAWRRAIGCDFHAHIPGRGARERVEFPSPQQRDGLCRRKSAMFPGPLGRQMAWEECLTRQEAKGER